eukprot:217780_1
MGNAMGNICRNPPAVTEILGSGSFGTVYAGQLPTDDVVKAFRGKLHCKNAKDEFDMQKQIWTVFNKAQQSTDSNEAKLASYIEVAKPPKSGFCAYKKNGYTLAGHQYDCFLLMSRLNGAPPDTAKYSLIPKSEWTASGEDEKGSSLATKSDKDIMIHASLNDHPMFRPFTKNYWKGGHGFYNNDWATNPIEKATGLRGYFITDAELAPGKLLKDLDASLKTGGLGKDMAKKVIGFAYGRLLRAGYMGDDIEFTFGYYNGKWKINMLDFGKVLNVEKISEWKKQALISQMQKMVDKWDKGKGDITDLANEMTRFWIPMCQYGDINDANFKKGYQFGLNPKNVDDVWAHPIGMGHDILGHAQLVLDVSHTVVTKQISGKPVEIHKVTEQKEMEEGYSTVKRKHTDEILEKIFEEQMAVNSNSARSADYGAEYSGYELYDNDDQQVYFVDYRARGVYDGYQQSNGPTLIIGLLTGFIVVTFCICLWLLGMIFSGVVGFVFGKHHVEEYGMDSKKTADENV